MSIFEDNQTESTDQTGSNETSLFETLVGEGKKFKTAEDLARAKINSDNFIEQLKEEPKQLREDLNRLASELELLKKVNGAPTAQSQGNTTPVETPKDQEFDLDARIRESLQKVSSEEKARNNLAQVNDAMVKLYGDASKAHEVLSTKAQELGVGVEFLKDIAARSPTAFFQTVGIQESPRSEQVGNRSTVNTGATSQTGIKANTYAWYQQLRKDNPVLYNSPKMKNQMMKDALAKGDAFYT